MLSNLDITSWGIKTYIIGFEDNGSIITRELNIFQRLIRRILGYFANTHLSNALTLAKNKIFQKDLTFKEEETLKIMNLFEKARGRIGRNQTIATDKSIVAHEDPIEVEGKFFKCKTIFNKGWRINISDQNYFFSFALVRADLPNALSLSLVERRLTRDNAVDPSLKKALQIFLTSLLHDSSVLEKLCFNPQNENLKNLLDDSDFEEEKGTQTPCWSLTKKASNHSITQNPISFDFILQTSKSLQKSE
ncbi:MAG: hypothetical protein ACHQUC_02785 [Chlamydiales bacterium]